MRHAADSRWQPGRSGRWGGWREEEEGEDRSMWHMWVAVGGEDGEIAVWTGVCVQVCNGGGCYSSQCSLPASKYYASKEE